jgi:rRNA processing protein Gar1
LGQPDQKFVKEIIIESPFCKIKRPDRTRKGQSGMENGEWKIENQKEKRKRKRKREKSPLSD